MAMNPDVFARKAAEAIYTQSGVAQDAVWQLLRPLFSKVISERKDEITRLEVKIAMLEDLRPLWAQGFTTDSLAAQAMTDALQGIWKVLGASNQTEAMQKLREVVEFKERVTDTSWAIQNARAEERKRILAIIDEAPESEKFMLRYLKKEIAGEAGQ